MNWELYKKYGAYNVDGLWISDHEKWHYYAQRPKLYKRKKILASLYMLIPIIGIIGLDAAFDEMGLSIF